MSWSERVEQYIVGRHLVSSPFLLLGLRLLNDVLNHRRRLIYFSSLSLVFGHSELLTYLWSQRSSWRAPVAQRAELNVSVEHFHARLMLVYLIFAKIIIEIYKWACVSLFRRSSWITLLWICGSWLWRYLCSHRGWHSDALRSLRRSWILVKNWALIINFLKYCWEKKLSPCFGLCLRSIKLEQRWDIDWLNLGVICDPCLSSGPE